MTRLLGSSSLQVNSANIYISLISKQACAVVRHQSKKGLLTLSVRPSSGVREEEIFKDEVGGGKERVKKVFLSRLFPLFSPILPFPQKRLILALQNIALCTLHVSLHLRRFHRKWYFLSKRPYNGFPSCLKSFI